MPYGSIETQPSLLSQIVGEVEKLNDDEKKKLLLLLKKKEILETVKTLDSFQGVKKDDAMTDNEADLYISQQRKARYEGSKA